MSIKAICTWGEGPDVLLVLGREKSGIEKRFILYERPCKVGWVHGFVTSGSLDLRVEEAERLAEQLKEAAKQARQFDQAYKEQMERPQVNKIERDGLL